MGENKKKDIILCSENKEVLLASCLKRYKSEDNGMHLESAEREKSI